MVSPLTMDSDFVKESIDALDSKWILAQGSDLGGALKMARESMERGAESSSASDQASKSGKLVLILTDGEDLERRAEAEAERFDEAGIALGVIGVGTEAGAPVPIRNDQGVLVGYKKDDQGKPVVSRLNPNILKSLAEKAKGRWWLYSGSDRDLRDVLNFVSGQQRGEQGSKTSERPIERYRWPLVAAVAFLMFALLSGWSRVALHSIALLIFLQTPANASSPGVYLENRAGVEAFQKGDFEAAKKHFGSARAQDPKNPTLTYNEAVAQGALGQTEKAEHMLKELPPSGQVEYNLGTVYEKKQMTDQAIQHWAKAAQLFEQQGNAPLADLARKKILALKPPPPKPQSPEPSPSPSPSPQPSQNPQDKGEQKFKSKNLNADDAKKVMNELADREKDLKKKLERKQGRAKDSRGKDW
jgi:tetratricopeptide (TPR) repeat protein